MMLFVFFIFYFTYTANQLGQVTISLYDNM